MTLKGSRDEKVRMQGCRSRQEGNGQPAKQLTRLKADCDIRRVWVQCADGEKEWAHETVAFGKVPVLLREEASYKRKSGQKKKSKEEQRQSRWAVREPGPDGKLTTEISLWLRYGDTHHTSSVFFCELSMTPHHLPTSIGGISMTHRTAVYVESEEPLSMCSLHAKLHSHKGDTHGGITKFSESLRIHLRRSVRLDQEKKGVSIHFVKEDETPNKARHGDRSGILDQAEDWNMEVDLGTRLAFPEIVPTTLRPDIVLWSLGTKKIIVIELTVPWEERCAEAHERKKEKYEDLLSERRQQGWYTWNFPVEVGTRGFPAQSVWRMFSSLGVTGRSRNAAVQRAAQAAERASY